MKTLMKWKKIIGLVLTTCLIAMVVNLHQAAAAMINSRAAMLRRGRLSTSKTPISSCRWRQSASCWRPA
ncbi:MAG: hypothetical protein LKJ55_02900 [[Lactobacillus] timonensis]|uniref:hypothetical protein n=1 Tax=[Lactobacillus] timonensis TaxID=1970790 RepID=UPI0023550C35|nr:hypothetical protein [[Lactobacillus] timonensis]MCI1970303.1 hypothetical protein [[Lactobacillus] timonensis]